ncbi:hypothetical protein Ahy_B05g075128 [Arachis hypogaea]|uniref:Aminotransferase-like plant mobile domain-containing protein n=1 Tax=Arachis hypogaea TaxID=3818 RepID=A0A444Z0J3_ARAHY|nr:hypothetical protein Ahy_B05g075128 [Arachis hypogaea]
MVMAHQAGNDGDINRLNETSHYTEAADFKVARHGHVGHDAPTNDPETLRQYARCYIMLLIGGYLLIDKSNNLVHIRWLSLLQDFAECRVLSWGSAMLSWTYQSLCLAAQRGDTDIADCTPLLMSWIYQTFPQWCPPDRGIYQYPLAASLHGESTMTLRCRPCARIGSVRRRSRVLGCQPSRWITVHHTFDNRPTREYYDWWRGACRVRHLSGQEVLEDSRLVELPPDVQLTANQPRDDLTLPRGVPDRRRRAREVKEDTRQPARREKGHRERRPGEPVRRERPRPRRARGDAESEEEAEYDHQEDDGDIPHHSVALPMGPTPPPPPPPPGHGAWHSSGFGGQQKRSHLMHGVQIQTVIVS